MRKDRKILWLLLLLLGLAGCASENVAPEQMITMAADIQEADETMQADSEGKIAFAFQGELVAPGETLPPNVENAAIDSQQVSGCVGTGMETLYRYDGFDITVLNSGTNDLVYSIYFQSPDVSTTEGLSIGDSLEKVRKLYGEADTEGGVAWIYSDGNAELILLISDDAVVGIEYRMAS